MLTKEALDALMEDLKEVLAPVGARHGIPLSLRRVSYDGVSVTIVLTGKPNEDPVEADERDRSAFATLAPFYGLDADDYQRRFQFGGRDWTIIGFNANAPKYPLVARCAATGQVNRLPRDAALAVIAARPPKASRPRRPAGPPGRRRSSR